MRLQSPGQERWSGAEDRRDPTTGEIRAENGGARAQNIY
jgi:hypothetical protein